MQTNTLILRVKRLLAPSVLACSLLAVTSQAQVHVKVDTTLPWQGHVNTYLLDGTSWQWGNAWGLDALVANLVPANAPSGWPLNTAVVLRPNVNTYNTADAYWNLPDGTPQKILEANFYRDVGTAYAGQTVTFSGTILSNSIPPVTSGPATGWVVLAVIKEFTTSWNFQGMTEYPITGPGAFSINRAISPGNICQYGFIVKGPNTAPGSANALTGVGIVVEDADPAIRVQPLTQTNVAGVTVNMAVEAIGSGPLAYVWKKGGVVLSNGAKYSGATTPTLAIANSQASDSGDYVVTVSNTVTHATVDSVAATLTILDVVVTTPPVSQRVEQGSTVSFSVVASSSSSLSYQWKSEINGVITTLANGPKVSGATTPNLTLSNVLPAESGRYFVVLTTASGSGEASATLLVKSYAEFSNMLENPGFEADPTGASVAPWTRFEEGAETGFGKLQTSSDTYYLGGNVNVLEGNFVSYTTFQSGGGYYGIFQDVTAQPGQIFTGDMSFYNPTGDPLPGPDSFPSSTNECYLEVQFWGATGNQPIQQYVSSFMNHTMTRDVWMTLSATNAGTYGSNPPESDARYLVAPAGTTRVRFQVTMHDIGGSGDALGSLYYDNAKLMIKMPAEVQVEKQAAGVVLSWKSQGATSYQVQYKDTLSGEWQNLGAAVSGTGQVVTKSDTVPGSQRYYRVLTL